VSTFSVDGLVSGLATTDVINKLLQIERAPVKKLQDRRPRPTPGSPRGGT